MKNLLVRNTNGNTLLETRLFTQVFPLLILLSPVTRP